MPLPDDSLSLVQSMRTRSVGNGCLVHFVHADLFGPRWYDPMFELACHAHIGVFMEALLDQEDTVRLELSCHFAPDIPCDKDEVHRLEDHPNLWGPRMGTA